MKANQNYSKIEAGLIPVRLHLFRHVRYSSTMFECPVFEHYLDCKVRCTAPGHYINLKRIKIVPWIIPYR